MLGDWFVCVLILQYLLATLAYWSQSAFWKGVYFLGAAIISLAVLKLR